MTSNQNTTERSPLHPKALSMDDMTPGREIIAFNLKYGILERATVTGAPYQHDAGVSALGSTHVVDLELQATGLTNLFGTDLSVTRPVGDMGLAPYDFGWNPVNFTIDAQDEADLPVPTNTDGPRSLFGDELAFLMGDDDFSLEEDTYATWEDGEEE